MRRMFRVCQRGRESRWTVTLGNTIYNAYLDREQALLDAVDAARDSVQAGCQARVWISDGSTASRSSKPVQRNSPRKFRSPAISQAA
jgi:hypothetical protein